MPRPFLVLLALALAIAVACSGHSPSGTTDAPQHTFMDAPGSGSNLPRCTGMAYDSCNIASPSCMTGTACHNFMAAGITVCSPSCSATMPCPMQGGTAINCNMMGLCKPPMANACTP